MDLKAKGVKHFKKNLICRSGQQHGKRINESPCSEFSTRSQSAADHRESSAVAAQAQASIITSTSAVGAHGYTNNASQRTHHNSRPLKQLVVTAGKPLCSTKSEKRCQKRSAVCNGNLSNATNIDDGKLF